MSDVLNVFRGSLRTGRSDAAVAVALIASVLMLLIPLPTLLLDMLLAVNLLLAVLIILISMYTKRALDFTMFPTLLLFTTVFGLALNISTTRLILTKGSEFDGAIIKAFANFVVGSNGVQGLVVGVIIFIILIAVQFMVITKGATRIAEVAARFTLDQLPAKQMAIEAQYNSGSLTEEEATRKRVELEQEAGYFGAMDGASKFVSGNVKVGLLITMINLVGGFIIGMTILGESFNQALTTYTVLTIGDGLVSQLPALLISTASGLIVTRSSSQMSLGNEVVQQFTATSKMYWIAAGFMAVLGLIPGFPFYILLPLAGVMGFLAYTLTRKETAKAAEAERKGTSASKAAEPAKEATAVAPLDPISLELGYGLIPLVDKEQGAEVLERITRIRRETALDLGLVVPKIRIIDNMRLEPSDYSVKIKGMEVGSGSIRMGSYMAINPGGALDGVTGEPATDPAFGLPAIWITEDSRDKAERAGYTVVDSPSIIATHLTEIIKKYASDILGRQEVQALIETLKPDYPAIVEEVNKSFSLGEIQKVLQGLLREQVSIRNLVVILETLADYGSITKDTSFLIEKVRQNLGRQLCLQYADDKKVLRVLTIDPELERTIIESRDERVGGAVAALDPDLHRKWINAVTNAFRSVQNQGFFPLVLCSEAARPLVKNSTDKTIPDLAVLSVPEIVSGIQVESLGEIRLETR